MSEYKCTRCDGKMEAGYIPDWTYGQIKSPVWYKGEPVSHWFGGLSFSIRKKTGLPVTTYRCADCGYLENFAFAE
jgi:hypothetical protein